MTEIWDKIIIHADMDAFFASVEQLDNTDLIGKPVVIGSRSSRGVVSTASYEARVFGVKSAMPMVKALALCPHAIVIPPKMERYKEISSIIMEVFKTFSPSVEAISIDEAFIDMSGSQRIFGTPEQMGKKLKNDVFEATGGLTISVGIASLKFISKIASDMQKPDGLTIVTPENITEFLTPLPVSKLWGAGPKTVEELIKMGFNTFGDIRKAPQKYFSDQFGKKGIHLWSLANGIDERTVTEQGEAKSIGKENTLEKDTNNINEILFYIQKNADNVAHQLRVKFLKAKGVRVKLKTSKFQLLSRQMTLLQPADTSKELFDAAKILLKQFEIKKYKYRLIGITAFDLVEAPKQRELFESPQKVKNRNLDIALDGVLNKFGNGAILRGSNLKVKDNLKYNDKSDD
ncbi:MAG: DNA polymerase IV [Deltaproteobacteria bacterium]|nr:DNA polymerase IV [Deltaproteobacteria bacterium]